MPETESATTTTNGMKQKQLELRKTTTTESTNGTTAAIQRQTRPKTNRIKTTTKQKDTCNANHRPL